MTDIDGQIDGEARRYKQLDADFKRIVHNADILSNVISGLIPELSGRDLEFIKRCVSPDNLPRVPGLETAMHNDSARYVIMDNLFSITIPGEREIGLLLNIEAQGDSEPGCPILNGALHYASGIAFNQKGTVLDGSHYEHIRNTYSIWFILRPKPDDKNTIVGYLLVKIPGLRRKKTYSEDFNVPEIIIVNLEGSAGTTSRKFPCSMTYSCQRRVAKGTEKN